MDKLQKDINCPICDSSYINIVENYRNVHPSFSGLKRVACDKCKMDFANPMPNEADLDLFNASYFDSAHGGLAQNLQATAFFKAIARIRGSHLQKYIDKSSLKLSSILEIGPGPGFFASNWLSKNPTTNYKVIETDTTCLNSLNKIGVKILDIDEKIEKVDAVVISHVLEHVTNPKDFLKAVTKDLKVGGVLFIEVPCKDYEHKLIDEPHLLFFDKEPMKLLLKNLMFENVEVSYHGKQISELKTTSILNKSYQLFRSKFISFGFFKLFSKMETGLEAVTDSLERASVKPFKAHLENENPSWWLRAVAIKRA
jgi:SAM-dependent methyltransferase